MDFNVHVDIVDTKILRCEQVWFCFSNSPLINYVSSYLIKYYFSSI